MKFVIIFAFLVCAAIAAPADNSKTQVIRYDNDNIGVEGYRFG